MAWNFAADKPIFQQLCSRIILDIFSGGYASGEKLPTVRELSVTAGVNPNTMQRAFAEIEQTGLIVTKRGDGRYVTENIEELKKARDEYVTEQTHTFVTSLKKLGLSDEEIRHCFEKEI